MVGVSTILGTMFWGEPLPERPEYPNTRGQRPEREHRERPVRCTAKLDLAGQRRYAKVLLQAVLG